MNKRIAHIVLILIDLAAIFACYYVYSEYASIIQQLSSLSESITMQKPIGLYITVLVVPIIHGFGFLNFPKRLHYLANSVLVVIFLILIASGLIIDNAIEKKIIQTGYVYCENETEKMRILEFRTYKKDIQKCKN